MNREQLRKKKMNTKKKLTKEQYNDLLKKVDSEYMEIRVKEELAKLSLLIAEELKEALRSNKISEERTNKILSEFTQRLDRRIENGTVKERIPK
jgi:predicted thioredoxin/glutaredoxin